MSESTTAGEPEIVSETVVEPPQGRDDEQPKSPEELAAEAGETEEPEEAPPEEAEEPVPETPPEEIEFDLGGTKLKVAKGAVPEEVAEAIATWTKAAQRNHTQRSQELAETRKAADAAFAEAQGLRKTSQEVQQLYGHGLSVKQHIEQLEAFAADQSNWQKDPDGARQVSDTLIRKRLELQRIAEAVAAGETALEHAERTQSESRASQEREQTERMAMEGREIVQKAIPGFNSKVEADLIAYAVQNGVAEEHARAWALNPKTAIFAHKAMMWDRARAASTPLKPKPAALTAPIKGVVSNTAGVPTDPAKMNMEQYAAYRKSGGAG